MQHDHPPPTSINQPSELNERESSPDESALKRAYWRRNKALMLKLGVVWFVVSYGFGILLVEPLNALRLGGYKLGFWFAQQGSIYVFIALIFYYAKAMERLDREFGVSEENTDPPQKEVP